LRKIAKLNEANEARNFDPSLYLSVDYGRTLSKPIVTST